MARKIVQDDQVARIQGRNQEPVAKAGERRRIDRTIEDHRSADSTKCDRLNKGTGLPLAAWNRFHQTLTTWGPAAESSQIGLHSHFIEKDQALGIDAFLTGTPILPLSRYVRAILLDFGMPLRWHRALFAAALVLAGAVFTLVWTWRWY